MAVSKRTSAGIILLVGLCISGLIYLAAPENDSDADFSHLSAINPGNSKLYVHDLRVYGGMANVYADEFMRWFDGLWHGKSLAFTVACIAIFLSAASFCITGLLSSGTNADAPEDKH